MYAWFRLSVAHVRFSSHTNYHEKICCKEEILSGPENNSFSLHPSNARESGMECEIAYGKYIINKCVSKYTYSVFRL